MELVADTFRENSLPAGRPAGSLAPNERSNAHATDRDRKSNSKGSQHARCGVGSKWNGKGGWMALPKQAELKKIEALCCCDLMKA